MSDEEGQELVTKPFKLVTGTSYQPALHHASSSDPRLTLLQLVSPSLFDLTLGNMNAKHKYANRLGQTRVLRLRNAHSKRFYYRPRRPLPQHEPDQALLAELC